ncbi:MAG: PIG-L family deacetylase [Candidatus Omnitrophota bacterium]|nr:PIG-L family deacetylase [Candidatus Omnitrophota bacterium]
MCNVGAEEQALAIVPRFGEIIKIGGRIEIDRKGSYSKANGLVPYWDKFAEYFPKDAFEDFPNFPASFLILVDYQGQTTASPIKKENESAGVEVFDWQEGIKSVSNIFWISMPEKIEDKPVRIYIDSGKDFVIFRVVEDFKVLLRIVLTIDRKTPNASFLYATEMNVEPPVSYLKDEAVFSAKFYKHDRELDIKVSSEMYKLIENEKLPLAVTSKHGFKIRIVDNFSPVFKREKRVIEEAARQLAEIAGIYLEFISKEEPVLLKNIPRELLAKYRSNYNKLIELVGLLVGYPKRYQGLYPRLNTVAKLERAFQENNVDTVPQGKDLVFLTIIRERFDEFLKLGEVRYDAIKNRLVFQIEYPAGRNILLTDKEILDKINNFPLVAGRKIAVLEIEKGDSLPFAGNLIEALKEDNKIKRFILGVNPLRNTFGRYRPDFILAPYSPQIKQMVSDYASETQGECDVFYYPSLRLHQGLNLFFTFNKEKAERVIKAVGAHKSQMQRRDYQGIAYYIMKYFGAMAGYLGLTKERDIYAHPFSVGYARKGKLVPSEIDKFYSIVFNGRDTPDGSMPLIINKDTLFIATSPHPDDKEIAVGGLAMRATEARATVVNMVFSSGARGVVLSEKDIANGFSGAEKRRFEVRESAKILSFGTEIKVINLDLDEFIYRYRKEEAKWHDIGFQQMVFKLADSFKVLICEHNAERTNVGNIVVALSHPDDNNSTHRVTTRLIQDALCRVTLDLGVDITVLYYLSPWAGKYNTLFVSKDNLTMHRRGEDVENKIVIAAELKQALSREISSLTGLSGEQSPHHTEIGGNYAERFCREFYRDGKLITSASPVKAGEGLEGQKYSGLISKTFKKYVKDALLAKRLDKEADKFMQVMHRVTSFVRYDPDKKEYRLLVSDGEIKLIMEYIRLAGISFNYYGAVKGFIWEMVLHELFEVFSYAEHPGDRYPNLIYFGLVSVSEFGKKFADEFGLALPRAGDDPAITPFNRQLYVKFILFKLFPELDARIFGFDVFKGFEVKIAKAIEGALMTNLEGFLSLLTHEERAASSFGHNYNPKRHYSRQDVRDAILEKIGGCGNIVRLALHPVERNRLKGKFNRIFPGSLFTLSFGKNKKLEFAENTSNRPINKKEFELIDVSVLWKDYCRGDVVADFQEVKRRAIEDFYWVDKEKKKALLFYNFFTASYGSNSYRDIARLILEAFEQEVKRNSFKSLSKIGVLSMGAEEGLADYWEKRLKKKNQDFLVIPPDLKKGDIVQIHSPFTYFQRGVLIGNANTQSVKILPIHYWADSFMGFLASKDYLNKGYRSMLVDVSVRDLSALGLRLKKEPLQSGYNVNIGEKFRIEYERAYYNATVVGIVHRHFILVLDAPVNKDDAQLGGYAMYIGVSGAEELTEKGKWHRIEEWEK